MENYNPQKYWEERLTRSFALDGVGYSSLGKAYNHWLYKVRAVVFRRACRRLTVDLRNASVLDIGSGTGFYIERWREAGVRAISGLDITSIAVRRLRERFPGVDFHQMDITRPMDTLARNTFQVVSAFDVLFHIVDDSLYQSALENINSLLQPGGIFIFSDNFVHGPTQRINHQASRSLAEIEAMLRRSGFKIVARFPMFVVMNSPADSGPLARLLWKTLVFPAKLGESAGWLLGAVLYPFELALTRLMRESPSTELMICRKTL